MTSKILTQDEMLVLLRDEGYDDPTLVVELLNGWLLRGDGIAVYRNQELGHPQLGHVQIVSFGSHAAQLETAEPPTTLPDIGGAINWRYQLDAVYQGAPLPTKETS